MYKTKRVEKGSVPLYHLLVGTHGTQDPKSAEKTVKEPHFRAFVNLNRMKTSTIYCHGNKLKEAINNFLMGANIIASLKSGLFSV